MTENEIRIINGKEIVLYREIETDLYRFSKDVVDMLFQAFEEAEQYRVIGTVEEFKALKEKNEPKKPINYDKHYYKCPICNRDIGVDDDSLYVYGEEPPHFCQNCGTEFDWS